MASRGGRVDAWPAVVLLRPSLGRRRMDAYWLPMAGAVVSRFRPQGVVKVAGTLLVAIGLMAVVLPFVSVWRVTGEVFAELPPIAGSSTDERNGLALLDQDFVLGTRTYEDATVADVETALRDDGFEAFVLDGDTWFAKPCCGTYDAVWVRVSEVDDTTVAASVSAADGDVTATWPLAAIVGLLLAAVGTALRRLTPSVPEPLRA